MASDEKLTLRIQITIRKADYSSGSLNLSEELNIPVKSFIAMCEILGRFRALSDHIRKEGT